MLYTGLSPDDSFDEAVADMITDTVTDMKNAVIKAHFEKNEAKKVLIVFDWGLRQLTKKIDLKWVVSKLPVLPATCG